MTTKLLYEYSVVGDDKYSYVVAFEQDYHPRVRIKEVKRLMRVKLVKELLKQGIVVDKIEELC